ncbi:uncharacterized protein EI90DRAFT_3022881 [Cantharellus anzutake]|uniref:uncharacterized protein n=1 Tax=Cantharellus anzutake TaxID=1750568 RepID=UPI0019054AEF|nr:uncharacterized protein EI90DRAFT_3022881 [Cantharellus anzutake]KAF8312767.1 hypothetical protein EI90DRAFT_3022881 [Cantharellus anzutake]
MTLTGQASANSQSICGSWTSISDHSTVTNVALFGIITKAELSEYGNQYMVPFNSWKEQGHIKVNSTKFQIHLGLPLSAPASLKKRFVDQLIALNRLKNVSTLGHLVEEPGPDTTIEIHDHGCGFVYLDNRNLPFLHLTHVMFKEVRSQSAKECPKINLMDMFQSTPPESPKVLWSVRLTGTDPPAMAEGSLDQSDPTPTIFNHPEWDPEGHFHCAILSLTSQKEFQHVVNLSAYDSQGVPIEHEGLQMSLVEGMAIMGSATLHFAIQIVGPMQLVPKVESLRASVSLKCTAEEELQAPHAKRGPFFGPAKDVEKEASTPKEDVKGKGKEWEEESGCWFEWSMFVL